ncbi:MAG: trigger factor [Phycisphaerae bacterium]
MDIPGVSEALHDPEIRDRAEKEAERLRESLKKEVQAEIRDIGTLRKEMRVTVPAKVISDHIVHSFDELMDDAHLPGFRKGRAPRALIERRFASEVRDSLKTTILGQSFYAAAENNKLEVLGDPLFQIAGDDGVNKLVDITEAIPRLKLPDRGDFTYTCELEVKPDFELPELTGIAVQTPKVEINDQVVDEHILRQRKIRGRYEPATGGASDRDDMIVADVVLTVDGAEVKREENVQLGVRATRLDGVPLPTLDETLRGVQAGEQRQADCVIPDDYERPDLRGKKGRFDFTVHEVKRLAPIELGAYVAQLGAENETQLREFVKDDLEAERERLIAQAKSEQVLKYLLDNTKLDVPPNLSARMIDRAVMRKVVELTQAGAPWSEIEAHIDELRTSAQSAVARDLKLEFILAKVAEKLQIQIAEEEVNNEIARLARVYNKRFDRVRDDFQARGLLPQLAEQIRQNKCVARILEDAKMS